MLYISGNSLSANLTYIMYDSIGQLEVLEVHKWTIEVVYMWCESCWNEKTGIWELVGMKKSYYYLLELLDISSITTCICLHYSNQQYYTSL